MVEESSTSFQSQEGVVDLINALSDYDFIFADAPNKQFMDTRSTHWKNRKSYPNSKLGKNDSILYLDNFISEHVNFECILGYSQGESAFIPVYLSNTSK